MLYLCPSDTGLTCEMLLRSLLESAPVAFALLDRDWRYIAVSQRWLAEYNLTDTNILGRSHSEVFPNFPEHWQALCERSWLSQTEVCTEKHFELCNGSEKWLRWTIRPWYEGLGEVAGVIWITENITERKQAEAELENRFEERTQELKATISQLQAEICDRQAVETELTAQKAHLDAFFTASTVGMLMLDEQLRFLNINEALAEIDGVSVVDHIGKSVAEVIPELAPILQPMYQQVLDTGQPILNYEVIGETPKQPGFVRHWLASYHPVISKNGKRLGVGGVVLEVTKQKQAEERLRRERDFNHQLIQTSPAFFVAIRADGTTMMMNDAMLQALDYTLDEVIDRDYLSTFVPIRDRELLSQIFGQIVQQGQPTVNENYVLTKAGTELLVEWHGMPIYQDDGTFDYFFGVGVDVTQRRQIERELEKSNAILRSVIESTPDFIVVKDEQGRYVVANPTATKCFNLPEEEILGKNDAELFPREIAQQIGQQDAEVIQTGHSLTYEETIGVKDIMRTFLTTKCPWYDARGNIIGVLGVSRDISDRKQIEAALKQSESELKQNAIQLEQTLRELQQTQAQLVQTEKMSSLGQLVAGVAHEINNPVNFIYGNLTHAQEYMQNLLHLLKLYQQHYPIPHPKIQQEAEAIDLDFLREDLPKLLASMKVGADRIQKIVLSLRNFSRMDEAEVKPVNIHEGIDSTLMILHNRLKDKPEHPGIEVIKDYSSLPLVECYAGQLNQVFMNILSNAIDALEEQDTQRASKGDASLTPQDIQQHTSRIIISTQVLNNRHVQIRIADNGSGMPEHVRKRIFEPFFTTKPVGKGTGLGLSISYQVIVEKHGGTLDCLSTHQEGTAFIIKLPLTQTAKF